MKIISVLIFIIALITLLIGVFSFNLTTISVEENSGSYKLKFDIRYSEDIFLKRTGDYQLNIYNGRDNYVSVNIDEMVESTIDVFLEYHFVKINDQYFINASRCKTISLILDSAKFDDSPNLLNLDSIECHI